MRNIEFQAWHKQFKRMRQVSKIDFLDNRLWIINERGEEALKSWVLCDVELREYTGLKDKYGVKLFDGSLIKLGDIIYELFFNDGAWQIKGNANQGRNCMLQDRADKCELVGNKYQNPELMKS